MKPTIAIYGIRDRGDFDYPNYIHDHSICVMEDGCITHYLQLERWTRRKYDNHLHLHLEDLIDITASLTSLGLGLYIDI